MPTMMLFGLLLLMHGGKPLLIKKLLNQCAILNMLSAFINQKSYQMAEKLKSGLDYALDSKTMNIMNNMIVINISITTRSAEDDNLLIV